MSEASTVAGNTEEGAAAGRISERVNEALAGISKDFETAAEQLDRESVEAKINGAFAEYYIDHKAAVEKVERNGVTISRNVVSAAERMNQTDSEAEEGYRSSFYLNPILAPPPQQHPNVLAPGHQQTYDTHRILREINNQP